MKYTENQQKAINHWEGNQQIIACAGSGKTDVITRRIAKLISTGVDTASIVALYDGFKDLLKQAITISDVCIVTVGIKTRWEHNLRKEDLSFFNLIGGIHNDIDDFLTVKKRDSYVNISKKKTNCPVFSQVNHIKIRPFIVYS